MRLILITLTFFLLAPLAEAATFDPSFKFQTIETPHFSVHFHNEVEDLAKRAAVMAEDVHARLSPLLRWKPEEKTNLVIADNSDMTNGMATSIPWNAIYLQPAPPSIISSIGEYDDWLRMLIIHEYAHILTSDPVRGYSRVIRKIFGKTYPVGDLLLFAVTAPPNMLMPRWWHEGMATWSETELTSSGRGRSSFYEMILRSAVAENRLPTIDLLNGEVPFWPGGNLPYIYGSRLIQYIAESFGKNAPGDLSYKQSGRFPFFINGPPEELPGGRDYSDLYKGMLGKLRSDQEKQIAELEKSPLTPLQIIGKDDAWEGSPRISPDGKLVAFNRDDRHNRPEIVITDLEGKREASFGARDSTLSWSRSGDSIFYSRINLINNVNFYSDIYRYDIDKKRSSRITHGLRMSQPDISPDNTLLAGIVSDHGSQNIALLEIGSLKNADEKSSLKILTDFRESRVASPRWSPDGTRLLFTSKDNNGISTLHIIEIPTGKIQNLFSGKSSIEGPTWSSDARRIIYSTDSTGVYNLFAWSLQENRATQLTNIISGLFSPDISADGKTLVVSKYTSSGFRVALIRNPDSLGSIIDTSTPPSGRYPVDQELGKPASLTSSSQSLATHPYSPLSTLTPRFWLPAMIAEGSDGVAPGLLTAAQDVLGYHFFMAGTYLGTNYDKLYIDTMYRYDRLTPSFSLNAYMLPSMYKNLLGYGDYTELEKGVIARITMPFKSFSSKLSLFAGYHLKEQQALTPLVNDKLNGLKVFQGRADSFLTGLEYNSSAKYPWSITAEKGRNITGELNYFGKASGSELESRTYTVKWEEYFRLPAHHTIMLNLKGGMAEGERVPQQAFQLGGITTPLNPFGLRGYESRFATGDYIATGTLEYRFPAWYFLRGFGTKPIFLDRVHGALFIEAGEVWEKGKSFRDDRIKGSAGTEIRFDMTLGYWLKITPTVGYARGFDRDAIDHLYFSIYTNL